MVLYSGPSRFDSAPIVAILTNALTSSKNPKTGDVAQLWILLRDIAPHDAVRSGDDASICGDCVFRGVNGQQRTCYVRVHEAALSVWRAYQRGRYQDTAPTQAGALLAANGRTVRLGAYGDPCAVPIDVLADLTRHVPFLGYTHAWSRPENRAYARYCMASIEREDDIDRAHAFGYRTFRARLASDPLRLHVETICPASEEGGHSTTCERCTLCAGNQRHARDVAIIAHGAGKTHFLTVVR